ncbi:hypothetical protein [Microbacterium pseudoresistens]|uniref:Uncharacterized protein n=1 Tax=Microbacterium pseudoresistens TaxID=640634 RepID=A0A7Y9EWU0_9MICO|nr:hypothetical protein [Microbacterium pseudoresistens]NYD55291.1 hypothetical protein [Microbacterium pseudoresistens]
MAPRLVDTLAAQGLSSGFEEHGDGSAGVLRIDGGRPVFLAEAFWADIVADARAGGLRGALLRLRFAFASMPYLIVGAVGFRAGHAGAAPPPQHSARLVRFFRSFFGLDAGEIARYAPLAWRVLPLYGAAVALTALFALAWWAGLSVLVGVVLVLLLVLAMPGSIVEHIRMAAEDGADLERIRQRVSEQISAVEERCERVWVIAHSQGGYIAHSLLAGADTSVHPRVTRLTGLASGLRPIRLAGLASHGRVLASSWLTLLSTAFMTVGFLQGMEPDGFFGFATLSNVMAAMTIMTVLPLQSVLRPGALLDVLADGPVFGWNGVPMFAVAIVVMVAALLLRRNMPQARTSIEDIPRRIRWDEASSPSDLVGSMSIPELPDRVNLIAMPSIRSALFDHGIGAYFSRNGAMRLLVASAIAEATVGPRRGRALTRSSKAARSSLAALSRQLYVFRGSLVAGTLLFTLGIPAVFGSSVLTRAPSTLLPCLGASLIGWGFAYLRWGRVAPAAVDAALTESPRALRTLRRALRPAARESVLVLQLALMCWSIMVGIGIAVVGRLVGQSASVVSMPYNLASVRLIEAAMMLAMGGICLISRMGRPKLWNLAALLFAQSGMVALVPDPPSAMVLGLPGVIPGIALIVALVVHLCRRSYAEPFS